MAMFKEILSYNAQKLMKLSDSHQAGGSYQSPPQGHFASPQGYPNACPPSQQYQPAGHYQNPPYGQYQQQPQYPSNYGPAYHNQQQHYSSPAPYNTRPPHSNDQSQPPPTSPGPSSSRGFLSSMQSKLSSYIQQQDQSSQPQLGQPTSTLHVRIGRESSDSKDFIMRNIFNDHPIFIIRRADRKNNKLLHVSRPNGQLLATIKFGYSIVFTIHGHGHGHGHGGEGKLKRSELSMTDTWSWSTLTFGGEKWSWRMKDHTTGELKTGSGEVVARIERDKSAASLMAALTDKQQKKKEKKKMKGSQGSSVLKLERTGLSAAQMDEILIVGFATWEVARREQGEAEGFEAAAEVMMGGG